MPDTGRHYLAIPGPSVMPDRVLAAMHRPAPNIYEGPLVELTASVIQDLKSVARTRHNAAIYISNGHGVWEGALANIVAPGDKILVVAAGRFGHGWAETARALGVEVELLDFGFRQVPDPAVVAEALARDRSHRIRAVLATQVDTSSSLKTDIAALRRVLDDLGHPALLGSDNIAACGVDEFHMDDWGVDLMLAASQKGLMTPPGLGFVFFSDRAAEARGRLDQVSPYWDWRPRANPEVYYQHFNGTAPTHHLFALREALDIIVHEEGIEAAWARHARLALALWAACEVWGISHNVAEPEARSHAVSTLRLPGIGNGDRLRKWVEAHMGVTLGIPLGAPEDYASSVLRVGHMGHINGQMLMGVLGAMQTAMLALDIEHGSGGIEAAARVLAESA